MASSELMQICLNLGKYAAGWSALFLVLRCIVFRRYSATFANVAVSWTHAFVAMYLGFHAVDWKHPLSNYGSATDPEQLKVLTVSFSYFFYDSICCELIKHDLPNLLHHIATLVGLWVGVFQRKSGTELLVCLMLMEISNPWLHNRAILKELGMKDSPLALVNNLLFALTFGTCRLVFGPFVTVQTLLTPSSSNVVKVGGTAIQIVSAFWGYKIYQVVSHEARKRRSMKKTE